MLTCGRFLPAMGAAAIVVMGAVGGVEVPAAQVTSPSDFRPTDAEKGENELPNRLQGRVGITERLGEQAPLDVTLQNEQGDDVQLSRYVNGDVPVQLVFVYHRCPMLCSLILDGQQDAIDQSNFTIGKDYEALAISFDPRDTPTIADSVKRARLEALGDSNAAEGWHFLTGSEEEVRRLADAVGFGYAWDPTTNQFAHAAAAIFLTPSGVVSRYLYGVQYDPRDVRLAIVEAGEGKVGTTLDRILLTCYKFDPDARSYSLVATQVLKYAAAFLLLVLGGLFIVMRRVEKKRKAEINQQYGLDDNSEE